MYIIWLNNIYVLYFMKFVKLIIDIKNMIWIYKLNNIIVIWNVIYVCYLVILCIFILFIICCVVLVMVYVNNISYGFMCYIYMLYIKVCNFLIVKIMC